MTVKIFVAHHKSGYFYKDQIHEPIHVGKDCSNLDLGILGDNTFDNISNLNPFYCELTATYWAWKNIDSDYIGISHYRRYFYNKKNTFFLKSLLYYLYFFTVCFFLKKRETLFLNQIIIKNYQKEKLLNNFSFWLENYVKSNKTKIFALKPVVHINKTNFDHFSELGVLYIDQLKMCVKNYYPDYYPDLLLTLNSNKLYYANMVIMEKSYFNEYCNFIFKILEKHYDLNKFENNIEINYSRIPGYMAELLTNAYLIHKTKKRENIKLLNSLFINE